jgi:hypothetical protein
MINKPIEYWLVLIGMVVYVATRDAESESIARRIGKTLASALLAAGASSQLAPYLGGSEAAAVIVIMTVGLILLDTATALLKDRAFVKELIRRRFGGDGT